MINIQIKLQFVYFLNKTKLNSIFLMPLIVAQASSFVNRPDDMLLFSMFHHQPELTSQDFIMFVILHPHYFLQRSFTRKKPMESEGKGERLRMLQVSNCVRLFNEGCYEFGISIDEESSCKVLGFELFYFDSKILRLLWRLPKKKPRDFLFIR